MPKPSLSHAAAEVERLTVERIALQRQIPPLEDAIAAAEAGIRQAGEPGSLDAAARELRQGGAAVLADVDALVSQRASLEAKLRIVCRAIEQNGRELDAARIVHCRGVTAARRGEYAKIVAQMKSAIVALLAAQRSETEFVARLDDAGGSLGCGVIRPMGLDLDFTTWLADAQAAYGL